MSRIMKNVIKLLRRASEQKSRNLIINKDYKHVSFHDSSYGIENLKIETWNDTCIVKIGKFCSIGSDVRVILGGHNSNWMSTYPFADPANTENLMGDRYGHPAMYGNVEIMNDVWIGSRATILGGLQIGDGAIIAAGSHLVCDVPPYSIYGGNPAKLIRMRFATDIVDLLSELEWWNYEDYQIRLITDLLCQVPTVENILEIRTRIESTKN
jgi:acetyltransferase-like isoleucine patch superfamily enzyme